MNKGRRTFLTSLPLLGVASCSATTVPPESDLERGILSALEDVWLFNTHEHIIPEKDRLAQSVDFFTLAGHYAINDVVSAGLPAEGLALVRDASAPLLERWRTFEPWWKYARFTGYGQALRIALEEIYGVEEISAETLPLLNERIDARNKPGLYREILVERARIRYSLFDDYWNPTPITPDPEFFVYARKFDRFVTPSGPQDVEELEKITDVSIHDLAGLRRSMERSFEQSLEAGMVTVKSTLAYNRQILYHEVDEADAARSLGSLMNQQQTSPRGFRGRVERPFRELEDYMFHHLVRLAESHHIPIQIHTGLHAGNGNFITNSNPTHLTNLFFLYPRVQFDLFHISYPYQGELSVLAKLFPNVHVDFCWAHIISESVAQRVLNEMMETVPINKIFGFGGDYRYPELSYAHARVARRNIARVLTRKVEGGFCDEDEALEIGRMLLYDNPARLFLKI